MRIVYYYRSTDPSIIEGKAKDNTAALSIQSRADAFAAAFSAYPVFTQGFAPHFLGITFNQQRRPSDWNLWSRPTQQQLAMRPLGVDRVGKKLKGKAFELNQRWSELWPGVEDMTQPRESELLKALGVSEAATVGNAMSYFYSGDTSWVASTLPLGEKFEEVKASDFEAARAAWQLEQARKAEEAKA
jgi:hypothetical protein